MYPSANRTSSPSCARQSVRDRGLSQVTLEEPPPWNSGSVANPPMRAIFCCFCKGSIPSFFSKTAHCSAADTARSCFCSSDSVVTRSGFAASYRCTRARILSALSCTSASEISPRRDQSSSCFSNFSSNGMARSTPASSDFARLRTAPQSDTTTPSKPNSRRSMSRRRCRFSEA